MKHLVHFLVFMTVYLVLFAVLLLLVKMFLGQGPLPLASLSVWVPVGYWVLSAAFGIADWSTNTMWGWKP